jgi:hypothetical protein
MAAARQRLMQWQWLQQARENTSINQQQWGVASIFSLSLKRGEEGVGGRRERFIELKKITMYALMVMTRSKSILGGAIIAKTRETMTEGS